MEGAGRLLTTATRPLLLLSLNNRSRGINTLKRLPEDRLAVAA
jgi:hypothetical protein